MERKPAMRITVRPRIDEACLEPLEAKLEELNGLLGKAVAVAEEINAMEISGEVTLETVR